jgi:hypothetical protein
MFFPQLSYLLPSMLDLGLMPFPPSRYGIRSQTGIPCLTVPPALTLQFPIPTGIPFVKATLKKLQENAEYTTKGNNSCVHRNFSPVLAGAKGLTGNASQRRGLVFGDEAAKANT